MILEPIGVIHTPFLRAEGTPVQPRSAQNASGTVEILPALTAGLKDLEGFERIWLLYHLDRAQFEEKNLIVIPYLDPKPHGVFATRVPARPNGIGMSAVRLDAVEGNLLRISEVDILDGTPLLDIKPYAPQFDAFEVSRYGWMQDVSLSRQVADNRFHKK